MKKYILRVIALLIFASAITSCSVEYRQRHGGGGEHRDEHRDRDHHDQN